MLPHFATASSISPSTPGFAILNREGTHCLPASNGALATYYSSERSTSKSGDKFLLSPTFAIWSLSTNKSI